MTCFNAARDGAIYLHGFALENSIASRARLIWIAPPNLMGIFDAAGYAPLIPASGHLATIRALLRVFAWCGEFTTMHLFVAVQAQRYSVIELESEVWKFRQWLFVVGLNITLSLTAMLARIIISLKDSFAPFSEIAFVLAANAVCGLATFPSACFGSCIVTGGASARTKARTLISAIECDAAMEALTRLGGIASRPTRFGAVMGSAGTIGFDLKFNAALLARVRYLCVFHRFIISQNTQISPAYVAVALQRYFDATSIQPVLLQAAPVLEAA